MKTTITHTIIALMLCFGTASAQKYYLLQTATGNGGGSHATSSSYTMNSTTGQASAGSSGSSGFSADGGFLGQYNTLSEYFSGTFAVDEGWNLLSVPKVVGNYSKDVLYPTATSPAYSYGGGYTPMSVLDNGTGFWLKYASDSLVSISGIAVPFDTISVKKGWNIIGSVGNSVTTSSIEQIPSGIVTSSYFGYSGGYSSASSIEPGRGYWVKVNTDGKLVLTAPSAMMASKTIAANQNSSDGMNAMTIETVDGKKKSYRQQLVFGVGSEDTKNVEQYDLPPQGPGSKLDVRFASNRYGEIFSGDVKELPISIQSNGGSLKFSMTANERAGAKYVLVERKKDQIVAEHKLTGDKSIIIKPEEGKTYSLRVDEVPLTYSLEQNYPNPFNPSTVIRYQLPVNGRVTLKIYDMLGQEVTTLIDGEQGAGFQSVVWNASNVATGVYFYRVTAVEEGKGKAFTAVKKMLLVK